KDPALEVTSEGKPHTKFSLAVDQGKDQEALWLNITCWGELAETMERLLYKGAQVFVQGKLKRIRPMPENTSPSVVIVALILPATFCCLIHHLECFLFNCPGQSGDIGC